MAGPIRTRGLVLRTIAYSDTSQIVWVFARDEGIVSLLARGALRLPRRSSSFQAPFDVAGWYDIVYRPRRGDLHLATEGRLVEGFDHVRRHLDRYLDVCLAIETMLRVFQPHDPHPHFLRGTLSYLKLLGVGHGRRALRVHFHSMVLEAAGVTPEWRHCIECGNPTDGIGVALRIPSGVVCASCKAGVDEPIALEVVEFLDDQARVPWGRVPHLRPGARLLSAAWSIQRRLLLHHLERPLRTLAYVRE